MSASIPDSLAYLGRRRTSPLEYLAAFVLGFVGVILLAIAAAGYALQSVSTLNPSQAADAARLLGAAPAILVLGALHVVAAIMTLANRRARLLAAVLDAAATAVAVTGFVLVAVGVDPFAAWRASSAAATSDGLGILAVLVLVYGSAAVVTVHSAAR